MMLRERAVTSASSFPLPSPEEAAFNRAVIAAAQKGDCPAMRSLLDELAAQQLAKKNIGANQQQDEDDNEQTKAIKEQLLQCAVCCYERGGGSTDIEDLFAESKSIKDTHFQLGTTRPRNEGAESQQQPQPQQLCMMANVTDARTLTPLHHAAMRDHSAIIDLMLKAHPTSVDVKARRSGNITALHCAARNGCLLAAKCLLDCQADVDAVSTQGATPLHHAALGGHQELTTLLVASGAQLDAKDRGGATPLHQSAKCAHPCVTKFLLACGADTTAVDASGATPLHSVVTTLRGTPHRHGIQEDPAIVNPGLETLLQLLDDGGADVNAADKEGITPLHLAVSAACGKPLAPGALPFDAFVHSFTQLSTGDNGEQQPNPAMEAVHLLLQRGAFVDQQDRRGTTALTRAIQSTSVKGMQLLIAAGASVNDVLDVDGWAPLHHAAFAGEGNAIEFLLACGAKLDAVDNCGSSPLHVAIAMASRRSLAALLLPPLPAQQTKEEENGEELLSRHEFHRHLTAVGNSIISANAEGWSPLQVVGGGGGAAQHSTVMEVLLLATVTNCPLPPL